MKSSPSNSNSLSPRSDSRRSALAPRLVCAGLILLLALPGACRRREEAPTPAPAPPGAAPAAAAGEPASAPAREYPAEGAPPDSDSPLARLPGGGRQVRFDLGQAADYFAALTAFEVRVSSRVQTRSGSGPAGESRQDLRLRQGSGKDFELEFAVQVKGGSEAARQSSFSAIRKGDFSYLRVGKQERFFRNRAGPDFEASRYVELDGIRSYLNLLQSGSTFSSLRSKYLNRPVRVYRLVASLPLSENPAYSGPPFTASSQQGEVWVDEASGLVLKSNFRMKKEGAGESGEKVFFEENGEFAITQIGDMGEIEAPKDYYENTEQAVSGAPQVPLSVEGGKDDRHVEHR